MSKVGSSPRGFSHALAPLGERSFRTIWLASLFSSLGQLIFGVAVGWEMTRLSDSPATIALVQTAMMLPLTIITLPAGALADMFDRRIIAMLGLGFTAATTGTLAVIAYLGWLTPPILLASCLLVGTGLAIYLPSWQASIPEQVARENLPAAVGLASLSSNVARSFGPALGGVIILAAGAKAAFALTSLFFLPLLTAFYRWERRQVPSRLPPERIDRAIASGVRYAFHSPGMRAVLMRVVIFTLMISPGPALAPLVAKDLLGGNAMVLGILLGAQGVGAVLAAVFVDRIRRVARPETAMRLLTVGAGMSIVAIGLSPSMMLTAAAFFLFGGCYITTLAVLNVGVQLAAPRWVVARAVSLFASATTVGIGLGAWLWGTVAESHGVAAAFVLAGLGALLTIAVGFASPLVDSAIKDQSNANFNAIPAVGLELTMRSGPIVIEISYNVEPESAREFYGAILRLQRVRQRLGGYNWSIVRDIADPSIWIERYQCSTWGDYLRMLARYSEADMDLQAEVDTFHKQSEAPRAARRLERPFGAVRWKADSPDPREEIVDYFGPIGTS